MQRLTISVDACTESLGLLVAMAWADGRLDDDEKAGVRGAAQVFNLSKDSPRRRCSARSAPSSTSATRDRSSSSD